MTHHIILGGVPPTLLGKVDAKLYEVTTLEEIWELEQHLDMRHYDTDTVVVIGHLRPPAHQLACTITDVAYQLRCISEHLRIIFFGYADAWVVHELERFEINAYVDARYAHELPIALQQVCNGKGRYISPSIDMDSVASRQRLNWRQAFVVESIASGHEQQKIHFAANFEKPKAVYNISGQLRKRFDVKENAALVTRLIKSGYLMV